MNRTRAASCLIAATLASGMADGGGRAGDHSGACSPDAVAQRALSSGELCPESALTGSEERHACAAGFGRYRAAMDAMCAGWAGRVPASQCEEACSGNGFDFASWSCRLVTDNHRFLRRCLSNGAGMARDRISQCVAACRGPRTPGLPGAFSPTGPADILR